MSEERRYGSWAGNPKGTKEDPKKCIEEIYPSKGWIPCQCSKNRGYGPEGLYCKQHGKKHEEILKRKKEMEENELKL